MSADQAVPIFEFRDQFNLEGFHYERVPGSPVNIKSYPEAVVKIGKDIQFAGFCNPDGQVFARLYHVPSGVFAWYKITPHEKS